MTISKKTKSELILEVKKLQRKLDLSQKKQALKYSKNTLTLKDSKWDSFFKNSLNIIIVVDKSGNILDINRVVNTTKKENVVGKKVYSFVEKEAAKAIKKALSSVFSTKKSREYNSWRVDEKGITHYYKSKATAIIENKKVVAAVIDATEITKEVSSHLQLKESEQKFKLLESEEKYRAIYEQAFIGIAKVDLDARFVQVNEQLCNIFGYSKEELCSMRYLDITVPEDLVTDYRGLLVLGEMKKANFEKRYIHKSGQIINANVTVSTVKDINEKIIHFIAVFQDTTESVKAGEILKAQSAKFNAIIESSSHFIWTVDKNFCLTTFNENFDKELQDRYGTNAKNGQSVIFERPQSEQLDNNFLIKKYKGAFDGDPQYFEISFFDTNEVENWREIYLNPIMDQNGAVIEVSGISHDITEKKASEERIRLSLQEKEVLLKEVHHRVKNNLQVISSILNLQSSYVKDEGTLQILKESQNRIKSMAFIHESLYQTKDFSSINFTEYVINLSQNLIHSYSNLDNEVKLNLDIQNVFLNLDLAIPCGLIINEIVSNALKYAFVENSEGGEISIAMKTSGDYLELKIGDNGKGLPKNIDYRNTESLGLQLVVTLIDQLSGTIELNTEKGTNYTIMFKHNQVKNRI